MSRGAVIRDAVGVGVATGAYGLSFGALAVGGGLSIAQAVALSALMFTGASQFAFLGVVSSGGAPLAGAATAALLGTRNALYGIRLSTLLRVRGWRRLAAAQLVIDESTAMGVAHEDTGDGALGFWATGLAVFCLWNLGTLVGAVAGETLADPADLGLDAAVPAAFVALLAPRLTGAGAWGVALLAAAVAAALTPVVPDGLGVLAAAGAALLALRTGGVAPPAGRAGPDGEDVT